MVLFFLGMFGGILLSLFFSFGPAFFSQIQASIHYGYRKAIKLPFGVVLADIIIVITTLIVTAQLPPDTMNKIFRNVWIILAGSLVVGTYGLYLMLMKTKYSTESVDKKKLDFDAISTPSQWSLLFRGFVIVLLNPGIWVYWIALVTLARFGAASLNSTQCLIFFSGVLSATFTLDILKCKLASLLRQVINYKFLYWFNKIVGAILIVIAIAMAVIGISRSRRPEVKSNHKQIEVIEQVMVNGANFKLLPNDSTRIELPLFKHDCARSKNKSKRHNKK